MHGPDEIDRRKDVLRTGVLPSDPLVGIGERHPHARPAARRDQFAAEGSLSERECAEGAMRAVEQGGGGRRTGHGSIPAKRSILEHLWARSCA